MHTTEERCYYLQAAGTLLLVMVVLILRRSAAFALPQFFAEDAVFFTDALTKGAGSLLIPYAGYHHFAIRLVAWATVQFDPLYAPGIFLFSSVLVTLAVAAACFSTRIDLPCRPFVALSIVLVPHTCEVFANLTNINWILALGLVLLALAKDPTTPLQWGIDLVAMCLTGMSGPFVVVWLPVFVWRAFRRKSAPSATLVLLALACSAIHITALLAEHTTNSVDQFPASNWLAVPMLRLVGCLVLPRAFAQTLPFWLVVTLGVSFLAFILWRAAKSKYREQGWVTFAAVLLLTGIVLFKFRSQLDQILPPENGDRYFYIQKVLLLWLLFYGFGSDTVWKWVSTLLAAASLVACSFHFRWSEGYIDYDWPTYAAKIRRGEAVVVPINPASWKMPLPDKAHRVH
jgi:hypothetical protein